MASSFIVGLTVLNIAFFAYVFLYVGFVYQNSVFTFSQLPVANVPWYGGTFWDDNMQRYNLEWWLMLITTFDFLVPAAVLTGYIFEFQGLDGGRFLALGYLFWDGVLQLKYIYRIIQFTSCSNWQICRNENPSGNPGDPSFLFQFVFWANLSWIVVWAIFLYLASTIKSQSKEDKTNAVDEELEKTIGISRQELCLVLAFYKEKIRESEMEEMEDYDYMPESSDVNQQIPQKSKKEKVSSLSHRKKPKI